MLHCVFLYGFGIFFCLVDKLLAISEKVQAEFLMTYVRTEPMATPTARGTYVYARFPDFYFHTTSLLAKFQVQNHRWIGHPWEWCQAKEDIACNSIIFTFL